METLIIIVMSGLGTLIFTLWSTKIIDEFNNDHGNIITSFLEIGKYLNSIYPILKKLMIIFVILLLMLIIIYKL